MFGNFLEVWNTMVHTWMPQKSAEWILHRFFIFVIFLAGFEFLHFLLGLPWRDISSHDELLSIIPLKKSYSSFHCLATYQEQLKFGWSLQNWAKITKNEDQPKNVFCICLRHPSMDHGVSIPQINTQTLMIEWWKGYSVRFTFSWEIS